jgi:hypothetical protein
MPTVDQHFSNRAPAVRDIYNRLLAMVSGVGSVRVEPKKTSIHLCRRTAFAGIATRKDALILTLKSATDIRSRRIYKREQVSTNRWHLELKLQDAKEVDAELQEWVERAIDISQ